MYDLTVSVYENVTKGIPDPSVFNVPVFCHHRQVSSGRHHFSLSTRKFSASQTRGFTLKKELFLDLK